MRFLTFLVIAIFFIPLTSCETIAIHMTPKKQAIASYTQLAKTAENTFWNTLHRGEYQQIQEVQKLLLAAYLENPNDPQLAAHLGFLHIWKITERNREQTIPPSIVNDIILSKKYFADAHELNPHDARFLGFYGDSMLVEGKIFHDEREQVRAYFILKRAIRMWPEFNYFTAGYPMSTLPANSKQFKEGLAWQWDTLTLCAQHNISKNNPDFSPYMHLETQVGPKRACWNSWIAPHNFEGFFLNMGDMLVKSGDWQTGIKIYNNAKLSKTYNAWPYRELLENRIQQAQKNVSNFQKEERQSPQKTILFNSGYGCMACHQSQ